MKKHSISRKRSRGQAIFLALAAMAFLTLMTYAAFNISQMTHAKSQTMNAADAGAYTLATLVARDLNFMAYTNRAMVANHVVVGQLTSLASLSNMIHLAAGDLKNLQYLSWIPYVGSIFNAIGKAFEYMEDIIEDVVWEILQIATQVQNGLIKVISLSQLGVHAMTAYDMSRVGNIVEANDPELRWAVGDGGGWFATATTIEGVANTFFGGFSERRDDDDALNRMREVVNLSRDGFTLRREWVPAPPWPIKSKYLFHGGTQLSSNNKTWVGVDGFEMEQWRPWPRSNRWFRMWLTGEVAGEDDADDWSSLSRGRLTRTGHRRAYNNRRRNLEDYYDGIQPYQELTGDPKAGERPSRTFTMLVFKNVQSDSTPSANQTFQTGSAGNPFRLDEGRPRIYGAAAAQVYFRRPTRDDPTGGPVVPNIASYRDGHYATLFSPYWQARLTNLPVGISAALLLGVNN